jgi:hypothetical protein
METNIKKEKQTLICEINSLASILDVSPYSLCEVQNTALKQHEKGLKKYGVTLADAKLSQQELRQHLLEELIDAINYAFAIKNNKNGLHSDKKRQ